MVFEPRTRNAFLNMDKKMRLGRQISHTILNYHFCGEHSLSGSLPMRPRGGVTRSRGVEILNMIRAYMHKRARVPTRCAAASTIFSLFLISSEAYMSARPYCCTAASTIFSLFL